MDEWRVGAGVCSLRIPSRHGTVRSPPAWIKARTGQVGDRSRKQLPPQNNGQHLLSIQDSFNSYMPENPGQRTRGQLSQHPSPFASLCTGKRAFMCRELLCNRLTKEPSSFLSYTTHLRHSTVVIKSYPSASVLRIGLASRHYLKRGQYCSSPSMGELHCSSAFSHIICSRSQQSSRRTVVLAAAGMQTFWLECPGTSSQSRPSHPGKSSVLPQKA